MKIALGNDHVGYDYAPELIAYLQTKGYEVEHVGAYSSQSVDYPEYGIKVAELIAKGDCQCGLLICGTGVGISLAANKVTGIRAAVCSEPYTARLAKQHNDANIIAFGSRVVGIEMAKAIVDAYLEAEFEGGRHARRVNQIEPTAD